MTKCIEANLTAFKSILGPFRSIAQMIENYLKKLIEEISFQMTVSFRAKTRPMSNVISWNIDSNKCVVRTSHAIH